MRKTPNTQKKQDSFFRIRTGKINEIRPRAAVGLISSPWKKTKQTHMKQYFVISIIDLQSSHSLERADYPTSLSPHLGVLGIVPGCDAVQLARQQQQDQLAPCFNAQKIRRHSGRNSGRRRTAQLRPSALDSDTTTVTHYESKQRTKNKACFYLGLLGAGRGEGCLVCNAAPAAPEAPEAESAADGDERMAAEASESCFH